jgi:hypothetical protein
LDKNIYYGKHAIEILFGASDYLKSQNVIKQKSVIVVQFLMTLELFFIQSLNRAFKN